MNTLRERQAASRSAAASSGHPAARIGRAAIAALYDELALAPKPGLVSFVDSGSHSDMDATTMWRSLFALRGSFVRLAELGAAGASFAALERAGIAAEARMLAATSGVNTHRGAIFCLGLLCASAGAVSADSSDAALAAPLQPAALRAMLIERWGVALASRPARASVATRLGLRGAAAEAAQGFPVLFDCTWPALVDALQCGASARQARVQALFATIAVLDDSNLAQRGGVCGLRHAQRIAAAFLRDGGALRDGGLDAARAIHADFVARRLSPGGAADMLAAACWLQRTSSTR